MIGTKSATLMKNAQILVVDDYPDVLDTVSGVLLDEGYQVSRAPDRKRALRLLAEQHFDVAVLDVRLDDSDEDNRDGLELMHEINAWYPSTAVIILTAFADVPMVREALEPRIGGRSPAFAFLEKTEFENLSVTVARAFQHVLAQATSNVKRLLEQGESNRVEFKSSLRWDYRTGSVNNALMETVVEAIVGMLNSEGGTLLIGVSDEGEVLGLEQDCRSTRKKNTDGFHLLLTDQLRSNISIQDIPHIHIRFEDVNEKNVCVVSIPRSPTPVFMTRNGSFVVRIGNSTRSLNSKDTLGYVQSHWGINAV